MKTIYVVFGSTGEYSDRTEWPVLAYTSEINAQSHVTRATGYANTIFQAVESGEVEKYSDQFDRLVQSNPYDSKMMMDYTGTNYYIVETTLYE
jgi:glucose-6-phosphate 1-dehydrogenase